MAIRGRHWFVLWLAAVCVALWLVVWRQTDSLRAARALGEVRTQRATLEGRRSEYERRIRAASSRTRLIPLAGSRLGLRPAVDSEIFYINVPGATALPR